MSKGKLIVLEGTDGSGKATQTELLCESLAKDGLDYTKLSFPRYGQPSAKLVELYLGGAFGDDPNAISAFESSKFYALDRYISYKENWGQTYEDGGIIVSDRYTTSNAVHQSSKMEGADRDHFFGWLHDLEHVKMGIPEPDLVIYLDMPLDVTEKLMRTREAKTNTTSDIHEKDRNHLAKSKEGALDAAKFYGWEIVTCAENGEPRSIDDIHKDVFKLVSELLA